MTALVIATLLNIPYLFNGGSISLSLPNLISTSSQSFPEPTELFMVLFNGVFLKMIF
jgi:hypothetical protein